MLNLVLLVLVLVLELGSIVSTSTTPQAGRSFGRYGSVRVEYPSYSAPSSSSSGANLAFSTPWPDAIRMNTNYSTSSTIRRMPSARRTYRWMTSELLIECNMTALDNPTCTRLVPPLSWMSASGSKVKVRQVSAGRRSSKGLVGDAALDNDNRGSIGKASTMDALVKAEDVETLFHSIDIDNNGYIDSYELYRALTKLGMRVTTDDIERMMNDADTTEPKDGRIDLEEWKLLVANMNSWSRNSGAAAVFEEEGNESLAVNKDDIASDEEEIGSDVDDYIGAEKFITISVSRARAEKSLSSLRQFGFKRADIYRMLEKGPWVLAFDISRTLPRISEDLTLQLGLSKQEALHVISHCPYLIAQYARYKGRDVYTTARALIEVGYSNKNLVGDIMRFPSMLSAPPDRLRGWMALLEGFGVKTESGFFGKTLKRAPFMFHVNPPYLLFQDDDASIKETNINDVSTTATEFVVYEAFRVLQLLSSYGLDMDKVVRSQPSILLVSADEVHQRANFLLNLFLERKHQRPIESLNAEVSVSEAYASPDMMHAKTDRDNGFEVNCEDEEAFGAARQHAYVRLNKLMQSNPKVLSTESQQMKNAANALLRSGMRRKDVIQLAKRHPTILSTNPQQLRDIMTFFKVKCGLRKSDLMSFFLRIPSIVSMDVASLYDKVEYLYANLGGNVHMLRRWPLYLTYDLDNDIRPRAEFVRACGFEPLFRGAPFLLTEKGSELSYSVGLKPEVYLGFKEKFMAMWHASEEEKRQEEAAAQATNKNWQTILTQKKVPDQAQKGGGRPETWAQEEIGTMDVDDLLEEAEVYFD
jgi:hypothetical protein